MKMKTIAVAVATAMTAAVAWTGLADGVTNVRGKQRENSRLVDIYYDIEASDSGLYGLYTVEVQIVGRTNAVTATTFIGDVGNGIAPGQNHHIVWDAGADWPNKKGDVRAVVTATKYDKVQLWEDGPYWAITNIGASSPEDPGLYFWWGDTVGHSPSSFDFYAYNSAITTYFKSVAQLQSDGVTSAGTLTPSYDAAYVQWGDGWRIPTKQDMGDLSNKCDWIWTTQNGMNGYVVRGRGAYASNSIFLPAAGSCERTSRYNFGSKGAYWLSQGPTGDDLSRSFGFGSKSRAEGGSKRCYGLSIRPVCYQ